MDEKERSRNESELYSPEIKSVKYDLRKQQKSMKEYFDDHIELKDLNSKKLDLDDPEHELSQLTDIVGLMDIQR